MVLLARIYYPEGYEFQPDRNNRHQLKFLFTTRVFHELSEEVFFRCILRNLCRSVELHRYPHLGSLVHERFDHLFDNYLVDLPADFIEFHRIGELADIHKSGGIPHSVSERIKVKLGEFSDEPASNVMNVLKYVIDMSAVKEKKSITYDYEVVYEKDVQISPPLP